MTTHPSDAERNHRNVTLIDVSFSVEVFTKTLNNLFEKKSAGWKSAFYQMTDGEALLVSEQLKSDEMQKVLKDKTVKFDVLLLETGGFSPFHVLADHFKIPVVGVSSADAFSIGHEIMGNVANPIAHPERILPFTMTRNFKQRIGSCLFVLLMKFVILPRAVENYKPIVREHFPENTKNYHELVGNVDLQLVNAHPALGFLRPILPNTIQLGFLHIKPPQSLPSDLQTLLDSSKHGVIFMSFGTIVTPKLYNKNYTNFLEAFADIPYDILWKFDAENFISVPSNVHIRKWFPQSDLLAHPKIKLFITHGVSSTTFNKVYAYLRIPLNDIRANTRWRNQ
jgi:glucuronosyltransferase